MGQRCFSVVVFVLCVVVVCPGGDDERVEAAYSNADVAYSDTDVAYSDADAAYDDDGDVTEGNWR